MEALGRRPATQNVAAGIIGKRYGAPIKDELKHFYICAICGQEVDMRQLGEVLYHEEPGHEPLGYDKRT
ncbi:MAG: hypothetical protein EOS11_18265 [Mesorhizobium sp.]|nr:MAG: hypothetical protein EOS11_18265 [Mesorhizobium sp.]